MKRSSKASRSLRVGPRRVASWIYAVINPLLDALETEIGYLARLNPTYRSPRRLEFIWPAAQYLTRGRRILGDLLEERSRLAKSMASHDATVPALLAVADEAHRAMCTQPELATLIAGLTARENIQAVTQDYLVRLFAARAVNNLGKLSEEYEWWKLWNPHCDLARALLERLPQRESLNRALETTRKAASTLANELNLEAKRLSRAYDVPREPVYGAGLDDAEA